MRRSRSHSTGMCIQRLSAAARPALPSAIFFMRSKYSSGKMWGKMSSLRSALAMATPDLRTSYGARAILIQRREVGGDVVRIANPHVQVRHGGARLHFLRRAEIGRASCRERV